MIIENGGDSVSCGILSKATVADADIRAEGTVYDDTTYEAWAWAAGVEIVEEEEGAEEDDAEEGEDMSVRMTLSALATASIAMLAM